jgi:ELWxxDGT repeat protein
LLRSSNPRQFTTMGSITFFIAEDDDHGAELWRTDGTAAGTFLLSDIRPGPTGVRSIRRYARRWQAPIVIDSMTT